MNQNYKKHLIKDPKAIIDESIHLFLFALFKKIIIKSKKSSLLEKKLNDFVKTINAKIIKDKERQINFEYSITNLKNILLFVKSQNNIFAGDIIEGILIYTFSYAFYSDIDNSFGKYIYSNLSKIKDRNNYDLSYMFKPDNFVPDELKNIKSLLLIDTSIWDIIYKSTDEKQANCVLLNFLSLIYKEKFIIINNQKNNKSMIYINKGDFNNHKLSQKIYEQIKDNSTTVLDRDTSSNSIMSFLSYNIPLLLNRSFFIKVFIYYQNKNSPLMDYIHEKDNKAWIPFNYELKGAYIEGSFASTVLSPTRIEPRINKISLSQNNLRENGLYEIGKDILFNKNIKKIDLNSSLIRNYFLEYLNTSLGIFVNYSVENLNLFFNYLRENGEEYFAKLLSHFKGLKVLILSCNDLKKGLTSFFIVLKKLYRKKEISLETLVLNKCLLDDSSYYELGELLQCKYCKLQKLYLIGDVLPYNINFLKKLKKNNSLTEIYLNKTDIGNNNVEDILRVINNTDIRYLYLYKNKITNMSDLLRIIYRTKIVKEENNYLDNKIDEESFLINLDLSNNDIYFNNKNYINLLNKIIDESCLYCLDISHILYGPNPQRREINEKNVEYRKKVEELQKKLEKDYTDYINLIRNLRNNEVDIKNNIHLENDQTLYEFDKDINTITMDKKAEYPVFLKQNAAKLLFDRGKNFELKEFSDMYDKLVQYMILRRSQKAYKELEEKRKEKKLIII